MDYLYCIWAFNKNYKYTGKDDDFSGSNDSGSNVEPDHDDNEEEEYKTFTYNFLIEMVTELYNDRPKEGEKVIRNVASWELVSNENFLKSLLINR